MLGDGAIAVVHCAAGATGGGARIALSVNTYLLASPSACKVAISCRMAAISAFIHCAFTLLVIYIMPITLLMMSVLVLILLSSSSNNYCAFAMVPGTPTSLLKINRF